MANMRINAVLGKSLRLNRRECTEIRGGPRPAMEEKLIIRR